MTTLTISKEVNKKPRTTKCIIPVHSVIPPLAFGYLLSDTVSVIDKWNIPDLAMVSAVTVASE